MRFLFTLLCGCIIFFAFLPAQATIINVPGDSSTIQGGIDGSFNGDTVLVAPGIYYEHINFNGKAILLKSATGAEYTTISGIIDGLAIVLFESGEDSNSVLDDFTVENSTMRAGIICDNASPIISNNIIRNNSTGVHLYYSSGIVRDNIIRNNRGSHGGIFIQRSNNSLTERNLVASNFGYDAGGGITVSEGSDNTIINNTIAGNSTYGIGGGIIIWYTSYCTVINNIIVGSNYGYGVYQSASYYSVIEYNDVWDNHPLDFIGCSPGDGCISADPLFCDEENFDYTLHIYSPCLGSGDGGVNMGVFGIGCEGDFAVSVAGGPNIIGASGDQVSIEFYVENTGFVAETFNLSVSDSLGWIIDPVYVPVLIDSGAIDTISFMVSIPILSTETTNRIFLTATSQTDPSVSDSASLTVTAFVEGWEVTSGGNLSGASNSQVTAVFYIENTGIDPDSCYLHIFDSLGWDIQPDDYLLILNPGQRDSVLFDIQIPSVPEGTTDKVTLVFASLSNPFLTDSVSIFVTCDSYNITITEISDIGNDEGKQVKVKWTSFPANNDLVTHFTLFRRDDPLLITPPTVDQVLLSSKSYPPGDWYIVDTYPAYGETLYLTVAPTLKDSTISEDMYWSVFFVRAGTSTPTIYFDSPVDSGYSLDNLAPAPLSELVTFHEPSLIVLSWNRTSALDFDHYTIYRDTLENFTPNLNNQLDFTTDITFKDSTAELGRTCFYLTTATDVSGNESDPSNEALGIRYITADIDSDGAISLSDVMYILNYLYNGNQEIDPLLTGDANCDGLVNLSDVIYLLNYLFKNGPPPSC